MHTQKRKTAWLQRTLANNFWMFSKNILTSSIQDSYSFLSNSTFITCVKHRVAHGEYILKKHFIFSALYFCVIDRYFHVTYSTFIALQDIDLLYNRFFQIYLLSLVYKLGMECSYLFLIAALSDFLYLRVSLY